MLPYLTVSVALYPLTEKICREFVQTLVTNAGIDC